MIENCFRYFNRKTPLSLCEYSLCTCDITAFYRQRFFRVYLLKCFVNKEFGIKELKKIKKGLFK